MCGRYLAWEVVAQLDSLFDAMLSAEVEIATRHFDATTAA